MKYIPECLAESGLEGHVEVTPPSRKARMALAKELERAKGDDFDKIELLDSELEKVVTKVEIKNIEAEKMHTSLDEMGMDPACDAVFTELQTKLIQGFPLGKS